MRLLLDSHALLWALTLNPRLPEHARSLIGDVANDVFFSPVSLYELVFKARRRRIPLGSLEVHQATIASGFREVGLTSRHLLYAANLDWDHGDPWDRILLAQAVLENMRLVSADRIFDEQTKERLWRRQA